ncbi:MAG: hypothetical protein FH753_17170 [Firmicutes bacterium]|nr:hypothetical protein [Bacillota bacterium]
MLTIKGKIKKDKVTKKLVKKLNPGDIALISHKDLDEVAAISLVEAKVKGVINVKETVSGKYPNQGPYVLMKNNIPIYEVNNKNFFAFINDKDYIEIKDGKIHVNKRKVFLCNLLNEDIIYNLLDKGYKNIENELDKFIENTLNYAKTEKNLILGEIKAPNIKTKINNKPVVVVIRGKDYKKDLKAIKHYIKEEKPVLIGVDGGGDALLDCGLKPDIVIGDMDSVSDRCLKITKELIVHAYPDGKAPGLDRLLKLGLNPLIFPSKGTSEDIALLLAYCNEADLIVAVGSHNNMIEFLEKGRKGMSSTFLVRLKIGSKLIDAKGVNKLYSNKIKARYLLGLTIAPLIPVIILSLMSNPIKELLLLLQMKIRLFLNF